MRKIRTKEELEKLFLAAKEEILEGKSLNSACAKYNIHACNKAYAQLREIAISAGVFNATNSENRKKKETLPYQDKNLSLAIEALDKARTAIMDSIQNSSSPVTKMTQDLKNQKQEIRELKRNQEKEIRDLKRSQEKEIKCLETKNLQQLEQLEELQKRYEELNQRYNWLVQVIAETGGLADVADKPMSQHVQKMNECATKLANSELPERDINSLLFGERDI